MSCTPKMGVVNHPAIEKVLKSSIQNNEIIRRNLCTSHQNRKPIQSRFLSKNESELMRLQKKKAVARQQREQYHQDESSNRVTIMVNRRRGSGTSSFLSASRFYDIHDAGSAHTGEKTKTSISVIKSHHQDKNSKIVCVGSSATFQPESRQSNYNQGMFASKYNNTTIKPTDDMKRLGLKSAITSMNEDGVIMRTNYSSQSPKHRFRSPKRSKEIQYKQIPVNIHQLQFNLDKMGNRHLGNMTQIIFQDKVPSFIAQDMRRKSKKKPQRSQIRSSFNAKRKERLQQRMPRVQEQVPEESGIQFFTVQHEESHEKSRAFKSTNYHESSTSQQARLRSDNPLKGAFNVPSKPSLDQDPQYKEEGMMVGPSLSAGSPDFVAGGDPTSFKSNVIFHSGESKDIITRNSIELSIVGTTFPHGNPPLSGGDTSEWADKTLKLNSGSLRRKIQQSQGEELPSSLKQSPHSQTMGGFMNQTPKSKSPHGRASRVLQNQLHLQSHNKDLKEHQEAEERREQQQAKQFKPNLAQLIGVNNDVSYGETPSGGNSAFVGPSRQSDGGSQPVASRFQMTKNENIVLIKENNDNNPATPQLHHHGSQLAAAEQTGRSKSHSAMSKKSSKQMQQPLMDHSPDALKQQNSNINQTSGSPSKISLNNRQLESGAATTYLDHQKRQNQQSSSSQRGMMKQATQIQNVQIQSNRILTNVQDGTQREESSDPHYLQTSSQNEPILIKKRGIATGLGRNDHIVQTGAQFSSMSYSAQSNQANEFANHYLMSQQPSFAMQTPISEDNTRMRVSPNREAILPVRGCPIDHHQEKYQMRYKLEGDKADYSKVVDDHGDACSPDLKPKKCKQGGVTLYEKDPLPFSTRVVKPKESPYLSRTKKLKEVALTKEIDKIKEELGELQMKRIKKEQEKMIKAEDAVKLYIQQHELDLSSRQNLPHQSISTLKQSLDMQSANASMSKLDRKFFQGKNGISIPACKIQDDEEIETQGYQFRPQIFSEQNIKITEEADRTIGDTNDEAPVQMTSSQLTRTLVVTKQGEKSASTSDNSKMPKQKQAHQILKLDHFFGTHNHHYTPGGSHVQSKKNTEMFSPTAISSLEKGFQRSITHNQFKKIVVQQEAAPGQRGYQTAKSQSNLHLNKKLRRNGQNQKTLELDSNSKSDLTFSKTKIPSAHKKMKSQRKNSREGGKTSDSTTTQGKNVININNFPKVPSQSTSNTGNFGKVLNSPTTAASHLHNHQVPPTSMQRSAHQGTSATGQSTFDLNKQGNTSASRSYRTRHHQDNTGQIFSNFKVNSEIQQTSDISKALPNEQSIMSKTRNQQQKPARSAVNTSFAVRQTDDPQEINQRSISARSKFKLQRPSHQTSSRNNKTELVSTAFPSARATTQKKGSIQAGVSFAVRHQSHFHQEFKQATSAQLSIDFSEKISGGNIAGQTNYDKFSHIRAQKGTSQASRYHKSKPNASNLRPTPVLNSGLGGFSRAAAMGTDLRQYHNGAFLMSPQQILDQANTIEFPDPYPSKHKLPPRPAFSTLRSQNISAFRQARSQSQAKNRGGRHLKEFTEACLDKFRYERSDLFSKKNPMNIVMAQLEMQQEEIKSQGEDQIKLVRPLDEQIHSPQNISMMSKFGSNPYLFADKSRMIQIHQPKYENEEAFQSPDLPTSSQLVDYTIGGQQKENRSIHLDNKILEPSQKKFQEEPTIEIANCSRATSKVKNMELSKQMSEEQNSTARHMAQPTKAAGKQPNLAEIAYSIEQSPNAENEAKKFKAAFDEGTISQGGGQDRKHQGLNLTSLSEGRFLEADPPRRISKNSLKEYSVKRKRTQMENSNNFLHVYSIEYITKEELERNEKILKERYLKKHMEMKKHEALSGVPSINKSSPHLKKQEDDSKKVIFKGMNKNYDVVITSTAKRNSRKVSPKEQFTKQVQDNSPSKQVFILQDEQYNSVLLNNRMNETKSSISYPLNSKDQQDSKQFQGKPSTMTAQPEEQLDETANHPIRFQQSLLRPED